MHVIKFPFAVALVFAATSMCAALAQTPLQQAERDEIKHMASEEPAMRMAFERARGTLDEFLSQAVNPREGTSGYALKVAVSDGRNTEYFWVNKFDNSGTAFSGHLGNEPRMVKRYKLGERFQFDRVQIVDWMYVDERNKRMMGNFTACALLTKETAADAEAFKKRFGLQCE
jgi:uncharacterized protein YegJ (DUF2314 family)